MRNRFAPSVLAASVVVTSVWLNALVTLCDTADASGLSLLAQSHPDDYIDSIINPRREPVYERDKMASAERQTWIIAGGIVAAGIAIGVGIGVSKKNTPKRG